MTWQVLWTKTAKRDFEDLAKSNPKTAKRVRDAIKNFSETGRGDIIKLKGRDEEWRLRVGGWRVIFEYDNEAITITLLKIRPRGSAYED